MIITLSGMMGVGKTSVGKELSDYLKWDFIDLDRYIETREGMPVREIFRKKGEAYFRGKELSCLDEITSDYGSTGRHLILSLGGGTPLRDETRQLLQSRCLNIYLTASTAKIADNLITYGYSDRPLLKDTPAEKLEERIGMLKSEREPGYIKAADITIDISGYTYTCPDTDKP